jgi:glutamate/aspartate transport system substrate-binding protein
VESGRAAAFAMDDILLAGLAANSSVPDDFSITKDSMAIQPYAIMMRKADPEFKKAVDTAVKDIFQSGEIISIYEKWFTRPIPPKGINLNWPMPANLRTVIAHPTSSGDPATYIRL